MHDDATWTFGVGTGGNVKKVGFQKVQTARTKNIYVGKVPCPECGSLNTRAVSLAASVAGVGAVIMTSSLIAFSVCLWIPILGWLLLVPFGIGILLGLAISAVGSLLMLFMRTLTFTCAECGAAYKIGSKEYKALARQTGPAPGSSTASPTTRLIQSPGSNAGWLADPFGRHQLRYWDGHTWTDNVMNAGVPSSDPAQATVGTEQAAASI